MAASRTACLFIYLGCSAVAHNRLAYRLVTQDVEWSYSVVELQSNRSCNQRITEQPSNEASLVPWSRLSQPLLYTLDENIGGHITSLHSLIAILLAKGS